MEKLNKLILKREMLRAKLNLLDQEISRIDQEISRLHTFEALDEPWKMPFATIMEFGDSVEEKETVRTCVEILKSKATKREHQWAFYEILDIINRSVKIDIEQLKDDLFPH